MAYVKKHAERRDYDLWEISLRMSEAERHLKQQQVVLNMSYINEDNYGIRDVERDLDSSAQVKRLLKNIDNPDMHSRSLVLENQAHLINFKR